MGNSFTQILAVISMNMRSIPHRFWMSLATLLAVGIVVAVLLAFMSMSEGFRATVQGSGSADTAIVLRQGSAAEINSVLTRDQVNILETAPGIVQDEDGPIVSPELYVIVDGIKRGSNTEVNIPLRGVGEHAMAVRESITLVEGRMFDTGKNEIVVGKAAYQEFYGFELGKTIRLGGNEWKIVGVFDAGTSVFGSELWADARVIQSQFNRGSSFQALRIKMSSPDDIKKLREFAQAIPSLNVDITSELDYFKEQSSGISDLLFYLGWPLSIAMAIGALAGALNTMYTSVAQRSVEIATLRAIGFSGTSAFFGTLFESLLIAIVGGVIGAIVAYLLFNGITTSTIGSSFTQVVFKFNMSTDIILTGIYLAIIVGVIGGVFPAFRASRMPIVNAFK